MVKKSFTITQLHVSVFFYNVTTSTLRISPHQGRMLYLQEEVCQCFFFYNVTTSTLRISPHQGRMLYLQEEVHGPILRDVRHSENVYKNERVGSYRGYALENFVISANA